MLSSKRDWKRILTKRKAAESQKNTTKEKIDFFSLLEQTLE